MQWCTYSDVAVASSVGMVWRLVPKPKDKRPVAILTVRRGTRTSNAKWRNAQWRFNPHYPKTGTSSYEYRTRTEPRADPLKTSRPSVEKDGLQHRQHRKCKSAKTAYVQSGVICNLLACYPCTCRSVQLQYPTFLFQLKFTFSPLKFWIVFSGFSRVICICRTRYRLLAIEIPARWHSSEWCHTTNAHSLALFYW